MTELHSRPGQKCFDRRRRRFSAAALGTVALQSFSGCASPGAATAAAQPWEVRLQGPTLALLGEVHDNAEHHRRRGAILRRAFEAGWRPAVVMEQFDTDRQADIERSRSERPLDAAYLIANAGAVRGWSWADLEPMIACVLQFDLPLLAGNLPRTMSARLARESYDAVLGAERVRELGLNAPPDPAWQAAQEHAIDLGHCGALPRGALAGMARAQFARDALMAQLLRKHAARGAVLLAGTGHVRRDIGVPRWLATVSAQDLLAVGFVEAGDEPPAPGQFDAVVIAAPAPRDDPCAAFRARRVRAGA